MITRYRVTIVLQRFIVTFSNRNLFNDFFDKLSILANNQIFAVQFTDQFFLMFIEKFQTK